MPRARNSVETVQITLSTTEKVRDYLEMLTEEGLYGKNAAETASMLLAERIRELIGRSELPKAAEVPRAAGE